jgi:hypothetical protein
MGPTTGLDLVEKRKLSAFAGIETRFVGRPVRCLANVLNGI